MSRTWIAFALVSLAFVVPRPSAAQDTLGLSPAQLAFGCAPPPSITAPKPTALRVLGGQDVVARETFGSRDLLVISGGTAAGAAPGQRYFIRRVESYGGISRDKLAPHITQTTGWVHIVSANESVAIAAVDQACNVITSGDYLEPFTTPVLPEAALARTAPPLHDLDFSAPGHVLFGDDERTSIGVGEYAVIKAGSNRAATPGTRLALYRQLGEGNLPLAALGEAVVVSAADDVAVVRIVRARDAVIRGDLIVPEKK